MLNLQCIRYLNGSAGYHHLVLTINGKKVTVYEPKLALLRKGFVWLGLYDQKYWERKLKPITVEVEPGNVKTFKGFTAQENIVNAVKQWVNYLNKREDFV